MHSPAQIRNINKSVGNIVRRHGKAYITCVSSVYPNTRAFDDDTRASDTNRLDSSDGNQWSDMFGFCQNWSDKKLDRVDGNILPQTQEHCVKFAYFVYVGWSALRGQYTRSLLLACRLFGAQPHTSMTQCYGDCCHGFYEFNTNCR